MMNTSVTKEEIESILRENDFEYQRVYLPYGLYTPGDDRSRTRDIILPDNLTGKSVLDIGCANGFFCFEAEARGAASVVGIELKEKRFKHANLLKQVLSSSVEFLQIDILNNLLTEQFDYVLLLNVIHHLKEPCHALRRISDLTKERLIIEFPSFKDPKFRKHNKIRFPFLLNRLPLIGVSSLKNSRIDQTFIFTESAIKTILLDHDQFFSGIEFFDSPVYGRKIAICNK